MVKKKDSTDILHDVSLLWGDWKYDESDTKGLLQVRETLDGEHYLLIKGEQEILLGREPSHKVAEKQNEERELIRQYVEEVGIQYLVHFTQVANLPSILEKGLFSRAELEQQDIPFAINDDLRIDGKLDGISLSIGFVNAPLFYTSRKRRKDAQWCILVVDPCILWKKSCAFYRYNAASNPFRKKSAREYMSIEAFKEIYKPIILEREGKIVETKSTSWYPPNIQSEVLVFDRIEVHHIWSVIFDNEDLFDKYVDLMKEGRFDNFVESGISSVALKWSIPNTEMFGSRLDAFDVDCLQLVGLN